MFVDRVGSNLYSNFACYYSRELQLSASSSDDDGDGDILSRHGGYNSAGSTIAINNGLFNFSAVKSENLCFMKSMTL